MDSIEKAIRNALAKGDPDNRTFREAVYRSAFGALDRSIAASPNMTEAIAGRRRQTLLAAITAIETEFVPAKVPSEAQQAKVQSVAAPPVTAPLVTPPQRTSREEIAAAPVLDDERSPVATGKRGWRKSRRGQDNGNNNVSLQRAESPVRQKHSRRDKGSRGSWRRVGLALGLVLVVGLATIWWLAGSPTGPAMPPQGKGNLPPRLPGEVAALEKWIDIFTPADPTTVAAPGDSRAEVMEGDDGQFLRIRSGASGTPVLFDIGQGVLEQIAGRRAVFSLSARGADGQSTQIAIDCNLAELGDCGRKRYDAGASREEFLFEFDLPAARVTAGGTVAVNPDLEGAGKSLDIYAIRVLPGQ